MGGWSFQGVPGQLRSTRDKKAQLKKQGSLDDMKEILYVGNISEVLFTGRSSDSQPYAFLYTSTETLDLSFHVRTLQ